MFTLGARWQKLLSSSGTWDRLCIMSSQSTKSRKSPTKVLQYRWRKFKGTYCQDAQHHSEDSGTDFWGFRASWSEYCRRLLWARKLFFESSRKTSATSLTQVRQMLSEAVRTQQVKRCNLLCVPWETMLSDDSGFILTVQSMQKSIEGFTASLFTIPKMAPSLQEQNFWRLVLGVVPAGQVTKKVIYVFWQMTCRVEGKPYVFQ